MDGAQEPQPDGVRGEHGRREAAAKMYKVYIVEDSPTILEVIVGSLESSGEVEVVGHADSAHNAWNDPDLVRAQAIIIDLALRGSSGFELLAKLKTSPQYRAVKKIVLTNYASNIFRQRALALGADHFFDKSLEFDQVGDLLQALAARHAAVDPYPDGPLGPSHPSDN